MAAEIDESKLRLVKEMEEEAERRHKDVVSGMQHRAEEQMGMIESSAMTVCEALSKSELQESSLHAQLRQAEEQLSVRSSQLEKGRLGVDKLQHEFKEQLALAHTHREMELDEERVKQREVTTQELTDKESQLTSQTQHYMQELVAESTTMVTPFEERVAELATGLALAKVGEAGPWSEVAPTCGGSAGPCWQLAANRDFSLCLRDIKLARALYLTAVSL